MVIGSYADDVYKYAIEINCLVHIYVGHNVKDMDGVNVVEDEVNDGGINVEDDECSDVEYKVEEDEHEDSDDSDSIITLYAPDYILHSHVPTTEHDVPEVSIFVTPTTLKPIEFLKLAELLQLLYQNVPIIFG